MTESYGLTAPADQSDRDRILTDLNTTLLVEAGAGSGKTTSLVGRLLALIESGVSVSQIAAITFTNKAADEMKERFRLSLEKAYRRSLDASLVRERLSEALGNLDLIFIGTIHSFCGSLLRERPIEAGLDPSFVEMDEVSDKQFRASCWDDYMAELDEEARLQFEELLSLRVDVNTLRDVFDRVFLFTDVELPCEEREQPNFDRIRETLLPLLDAAAPYIPTVEPEKGWDTVQKLVRQTHQKMRYIDLSDDMRILDIAKEFDRKLDVTLNRWTSKEHAGEMKKLFPDWQINVLFPFLQEWREYMYPKLIRFVRPVLDHYKTRRYAAGKLNFQDLLMEAAKLVRENSEVRAYFAERYQRLLVDEFQDTDPIQAELMFLLTGSAEVEVFEKNWRRLTPRPGSLFVVGDPKQSIYRFRRADISIYNEVKARIQECGAVCRLAANFRSVHSIGDYINGQFVGKFPSSETEYQAAFVNMETRADNPKGACKPPHGIYVLNYPKMPGGKAAVAQTDAEQIARYISWACNNGNLQIVDRDRGNRNAVPSDFLILTKTREFIHLYAEQLDLFGVPADTSGSTTVYEELLALLQLVRFLEDSADKPALLSVIRGMLFGLSDRQLWTYKQGGFSFSLFDLPALEACRDEAKAVVTVLGKLQKYKGWVRTLSAATAFSRIVDDLGVLPYVSTLPAGSVRAGTLVRMLQLLHGDPAASSSWAELCRLIEHILADRGMETSSLYAGGNQAVRIMNLHKAKGLEAPVVFLACPCGESDHDATQYIDRSADPATGYFTISKSIGEFKTEVIAQPLGWGEMNERERAFSNAEKDRLLYVAATRPKQMLVISLYPDQPAKCPWTPLVDGMNLARELDVPVMKPEKKTELTEGPDLQNVAEVRKMRLNAISEPTYAVLSVTGQTKAAGDTPEWSAEGKGMAFGSVVHRTIEMLGKGLPESELEDTIRFLADEEGMNEDHVSEAARVIRSVIASELWQRSQRARRRLFEVPLMIRKNAGEVSVSSDAGSAASEVAVAMEGTGSIKYAYVRGVIDFLFEEEDGWVIVDFKTDSVTEEKLQSFIDFYQPQVLAYASEWEQTFGYRVKEAGLYFVSLPRYVTVR
ncbi:UvrD-helicase domain-containing protein [Paenibacillus sp. GCM10023248]|uniref:UvrD-helicase domain-containing protein n=1 Tax=unclassified Paenibacillus TaxID=185978 RepID=UPI002379E86B|nr:UvrD-helicase domain-containing protein [Paenibacillus sp. MAHUQ-63]MDD9271467.1 UvrD-helicase domain-containing protein [Paenibacillus sp. MAHUQ-63]